jgi:eukaryotic-like serine/threonine-protein kinase
VRIYDLAEEDGEPWIVMEALSGRTLATTLRDRGPLPVDQATHVGLRLLEVLEATHRAGVVHRDVKPSHGGEVDPASDLFSLGATLFTVVEGRSPFAKGCPAATLTAVVDDPPAPFLRAGPLGPVIEGLLAKDPARRLHTDQARRALRAIREGPPSVKSDRL